jgi:TPR repeat protein
MILRLDCRLRSGIRIELAFTICERNNQMATKAVAFTHLLLIGIAGVVFCLLVQPATAAPNHLCIEGRPQVHTAAAAAYRRKDYAAAFRHFKQQAYRGNAYAQMKLGIMYLRGQGVPQDYWLAVKWTRAAAEQGNANAQCNLGFFYLDGICVQQDSVLAHMWFNLAAGAGHKDARAKREIVAAWRISSAELLEAQELATEWLAAHR